MIILILLNKCLILAYNAPTHTSILARSATNKLGVKTVLIAPYSPELAAVEIVFHQIKNKMTAYLRDYDTNFDKKEGIMTLFSSLSSLSAIQIFRCLESMNFKSMGLSLQLLSSKTIICKFWLFYNKIAKKIILIIIKFLQFCKYKLLDIKHLIYLS